MKRIIKYAVSVMLMLTLTVSVVFFPHLYYSVVDKKRSGVYVLASDLDLGEVDSRVSAETVYKLTQSLETIPVVVNNTDYDITSQAKIAVFGLEKYLCNTASEKEALSAFLNEEVIELINCEVSTISGIIDDKPVSATIARASYRTQKDIEINIAFDVNSCIVYTYEVSNKYEAGYEYGENYASDAITYEESDDVDVITDDLIRYWELTDPEIISNIYAHSSYASFIIAI